MTGLLAITLDQPWAWLVVNGHCDIINRLSPTRHRGPLAIHASRRNDALAHIDPDVQAALGDQQRILWADRVLGVVEVTGIERPSSSTWYAPGMFAWRIENPVALSVPIEVGPGDEGRLWELAAPVAEAVMSS